MVPADVSDRPTTYGQCLHSDGRNLVLLVFLIHDVDVLGLAGRLGLFLSLPVLAHIHLDALADGKLGSALTDLGEIGTRETGGALRKEVEVDTGVKGRLAQGCLKDRESGRLIGKRDVNQLEFVSCRVHQQEQQKHLPDRDDRDGEEPGRSGPDGLIESARQNLRQHSHSASLVAPMMKTSEQVSK